MSVLNHSPRIVTKNLVFAIDGAVARCWSGSGIVKDLAAGAEGNPLGPTLVNHMNGCFDFDGTDDRIDFGNLAAANFGTESFSAEVVVEPDSIVGWKTIMGKGASGATGWSLTLNPDGEYSIDIDAPTNIHRDNSDTAATVGQIAHICCVWRREASDTKVFMYINGEQKLASTLSGETDTVTNSAHNLGIGTYNAGTAWDFNGRIHLARLYNAELTAEEIKSNFETTKARFGL